MFLFCGADGSGGEIRVGGGGDEEGGWMEFWGPEDDVGQISGDPADGWRDWAVAGDDGGGEFGGQHPVGIGTALLWNGNVIKGFRFGPSLPPSTCAAGVRILPGLLVMKLNAQQEQVASHIHGRILTLAGPGSGKTRTLTERTGRLIGAGYNPASILCLTFTNRARDEMRERIAGSFGEAAKKVFISNF